MLSDSTAYYKNLWQQADRLVTSRGQQLVDLAGREMLYSRDRQRVMEEANEKLAVLASQRDTLQTANARLTIRVGELEKTLKKERFWRKARGYGRTVLELVGAYLLIKR